MPMIEDLKRLVDKHSEGIRYILFGILTVLVSWGTYALFVQFIDPVISNALSWFCAVIFAFFVNKYFVFLSKSWEPILVVRELSQFFGARIFTGIVAIVLFPILIWIGLDQPLLGIEAMWARGVTSMVEIALNWVFSKYMIFKKPEDADKE